MYQCLPTLQFEDQKGYLLIPIRHEDMETIRVWRNEQMNILRQQIPISKEMQEAYFTDIIRPSFSKENPPQILFSFFLKGILIGYGGITHIDWTARRGEISFLLETSRNENLGNFKEDFRHFLNLLLSVAFGQVHLNRLYTETFDFRKGILSVLQESGFVFEGRLREHSFKRNQWTDSIIHGFLNRDRLAQSPSSPKKIAALVTSISRKVPLIEAVKTAGHKISPNFIIHGCDIDPRCIGRYFVDFFWQPPSISEISFQLVRDYCQYHGITAIIPTRDGDLEFYAANRHLFEQIGIHVMISSLEAIQMCLDKKSFADWLTARQYPSIPTELSIDLIQAPLYVLKDRYGAGSVSLGLKLTRQSAKQQAEKLASPIFQPYIEGTEYSVDVYVDKSSNVKGTIVRKRELIVSGESQVTTTVRKPEIDNLCMNIAQELKLYGHAVFQVIESPDNALHIVECNPRFGGASTASIAAGLDSFYWFLLESSGKSLSNFPFHRAQEEIKQVRFPMDRISYF